VASILAGCGSSGHKNRPADVRTVDGSGFTFAAPAGWQVRHADGAVTAASGVELLQVTPFPLQKRYTDRLFAAVETELSARLRVLARESGGTLSPATTVVVSGIRSHSYRIDVGDTVDQYTFVLREKREYQLLCRRRPADPDDFCRALLSSFRLR